jgi:hypothetical protein
MSTQLLERSVEEVVARLLADAEEADSDHPAGPLYVGGEHAVSDIMHSGNHTEGVICWTTIGGNTNPSACTGHGTIQCC